AAVATLFTIIVSVRRYFRFSLGFLARRRSLRSRGWTGNEKNGGALRRLPCAAAKRPQPDFQMRRSWCHENSSSITSLHRGLRPPIYRMAQYLARGRREHSFKSGVWNRVNTSCFWGVFLRRRIAIY